MLKAGLITQSDGRLADWHSSVLTDLLESKSFNAVAVDVIVIFIIVVVIVVIIIDIAIKKRKAGSNSTSSTKLASDLELREAKEPDLSECLLGHKNVSQTYFRVTPANAAKTYLEKCMELLTFCDMTSVEHSKQELNQKLIKGREARIENLEN